MSPRCWCTRFARAIAVLVLSITLVPGPAVAQVLSSDRLGTVRVDASKELRALAPDVTLPAGALVTADGEPLWARNADAERSMASTSKIMTAIVVLDSGIDLSTRMTVPAQAATVGESGVGLVAGQELTTRQLLEAMLVHSGNDAAITLAVGTSGSLSAFVEAMNQKAAELDCTHSHFTNPHGLDEPGHHTSADDLATMARYAMAKPAFREIVALKEVRISSASGTRKFDASNLLIGTFTGATGVKTGWTNDAGYCVVASAKRHNTELFAVVLGTNSEGARFVQAKRLLEWGFKHYAIRQVTSAEETAALVVVSDYLDQTVPALVAETTSTPVFDVAGKVTVNVDVSQEIEAPVAAGDRLGTLSVVQGDRLLVQVPIVAAHAVLAPTWLDGVKIAMTRQWRKWFGGALKATPVTVM